MSAEAILITQCLQHDFVRPIERHEPLPNRLHVGYDEARRLLGERIEEGPVHVLLEWAYGMPEERLALIHIRDWHAPDDREQHGHLEQFGAHGLAGTSGAEFVFRPVVRAGRSHRVVDASGLNDFVRTDLERLLEPYRGRPVRVGIVGVWTEAKVTFLAYELATRYPEFELATCSALTASSSRAMHFVALDQLRSVLGVRVFASVGAFTEFLAGSQPELGARLRHARVDPGRLRFHPPDYPATPADRELLAYLFREAREVDLDCLDGGFSGNVVLRARSRDALGHQQVPYVVKVGPRDLVARERTSFERIEEVLGNSAPSVVDFAELGERGGIKYRYAAMLDGATRTFQKLYQAGEPEERLLGILETVFRRQLGRLYEAATAERLDLLQYYDFRPSHAPRVRRAIEALLGRPADGPRLELAAGIEAANPCPFYERELATLRESEAASRFVSFVHGDLNGANILVDASGNVWLIDFFHTHRGHVLKDLVKLENDVLYIYTPLATPEDFADAARMTRALYDVADLGRPPPADGERAFHGPQFHRAWRIVQRLRSYYPELIQADRDPYQLVVAALRYAVHTFVAFDESSAAQKRWALYTAAHCIERIRAMLGASRRLRIDLVPLPGAAPGQLGITILPGRADRGRNLAEDVAAIRDAGIGHVLSLLTPDEYVAYGVGDLPAAYAAAGLELRRLPIRDGGVPTTEALTEAAAWLDERLARGAGVLVHCVGGLGRSGLVVAAYLARRHGLDPAAAIARVRESRSPRAVENVEQEEFVRAFARPR